MKICSVTMAPKRSDAEAAIATVVDLVDATIVSTQEGPIRDFARARNDTLDMVAEDYDWAIMLDTDERIIPQWTMSRDDVLAELDGANADVLMVEHVSRTYEKERIFRLPVTGHYHGRTHEAFLMDAGATRETLRCLLFDEIAKTPEQYQAKVTRDLPLLLEMIKEDPKDPRWWYYLGDTYSGLGEAPKAKLAFWECQLLDGWDEESAWANYRIAEIECAEKQFDRAISSCLSGMRRYPGMAELPWLTGWCCYQLGQYQRAIWWEEMAWALNKAGAEQWRIGFRHPPALFEAPHDVMRHAYHALGDTDGEVVAEERFQRYLDSRRHIEKIAPS